MPSTHLTAEGLRRRALREVIEAYEAEDGVITTEEMAAARRGPGSHGRVGDLRP